MSRYEIGFLDVQKQFNQNYTKVIIIDNDAFCKYFHINYHHDNEGKHKMTISGSNVVSHAAKEMKFYPVDLKTLQDFKRLAEHQSDNYAFGVQVLKGIVGYESKKN